MNSFSKRVFEMLGRVLAFAKTHPQFFAKDSLTGQLVSEVEAAVESLSSFGVLQTSGKGAVRVSAGDRAVARAALRSQLEAISRTARALKLRQFLMPRDKGDMTLAHLGRVWAELAEPLKQVFIEGHLPPNFIQDLNVGVQNLEKVTKEQTFSKSRHLAATAAIEQSRAQAFSALKRLDLIMENLLKDDPPTLAVWESARHVERYTASKPSAGGMEEKSSNATNSSSVPQAFLSSDTAPGQP